MKLKFIIIIFIIITFMALMGCTSPSVTNFNTSNSSSSPEISPIVNNTPSTNNNSITPTATQSQPSSLKGSSVISLLAINWCEYRQISDINWNSGWKRYDKFNVTYNGTNAYVIKARLTNPRGPGYEGLDVFYDYNGKVIGGSHQYADGDYFNMSIIEVLHSDNLLSIHNERCKFVGTEPVTVPIGTYPEAQKYIINYHGNLTFWYDPSIPVPLKIDNGFGTTMELIGLG